MKNKDIYKLDPFGEEDWDETEGKTIYLNYYKYYYVKHGIYDKPVSISDYDRYSGGVEIMDSFDTSNSDKNSILNECIKQIDDKIMFLNINLIKYLIPPSHLYMKTKSINPFYKYEVSYNEFTDKFDIIGKSFILGKYKKNEFNFLNFNSKISRLHSQLYKKKTNLLKNRKSLYVQFKREIKFGNYTYNVR